MRGPGLTAQHPGLVFSSRKTPNIGITIPGTDLVASRGWCSRLGQALRFFSIAAWAAANRAIGTRNGEQLT